MIDNEDLFADKCMTRLSTYSPVLIIVISSIFVSFLSFFIVFTFNDFCVANYTNELLKFSIVIPLITTPVIVGLFIRFSRHLKHFKE